MRRYYSKGSNYGVPSCKGSVTVVAALYAHRFGKGIKLFVFDSPMWSLLYHPVLVKSVYHLMSVVDEHRVETQLEIARALHMYRFTVTIHGIYSLAVFIHLRSLFP